MKSRLTITLSEDVLQKVDALIDKKTIRNRSHAIENLIQQSLSPQINTALILAGGPEKQLYGPLTQIGEQPLIVYTLELLKQHGVTTIYIAHNDQGIPIKEALMRANADRDGSLFKNLTITYYHEKSRLGTAGSIKTIAHKYGIEDDFFVVAGDVMTNINLNELSQFHRENNALITMAVKPRPAQKNYDNVYVQGHTVVDFKASEQHEIVGIVNAGVYLFSSEVLALIPDTKPAMLEQDVFPLLSKGHRLTAFSFQGVWFDVSTDENYKQAIVKL